VVKTGEFEILESRQGISWRVNRKGPGDVFGEVSLMYNSPRNATVAATVKSTVFVLDRSVFRAHVQETAETEGAQVCACTCSTAPATAVSETGNHNLTSTSC
jgi:cGMP-dependent protein kinase 2